MGSLFQKPKAPKTAMPSPAAPAVPEIEDAKDLSRFSKKRYGRQSTILSKGMLEPEDIGKRTLLG